MAQTTQAPPSHASPRPVARTPADSRARRLLRNLGYRLFQPVDGASLAVFRMLFGAIMVWEVYRYFSHGWITRYWVEPSFHFTYHGFGWVEPLPGRGMEILFAALGGLAACIALGLFYRVVTVLFFVGFTYTFLLEQARYLNHFYLVCLLAFLLTIVPAHRVWSVDALISRPRWPETVPTWALWLLRAQIGLVFFFAGVAKLNGDWLRGEPLRMWLAERTDFPVLGDFFTEAWAAWLFSYGGLLFDLFVIPLLIWPRTRLIAFVAAVGFHMMNQQLFTIGIFPFLALGTALLFFPPDWPRFGWLRARVRPPRQPVVTSSAPPPDRWRLRPAQGVLLGVLGAFLAVQVLMPLRHFAIPGNVSWTEEGHRWAWHMKLRDKEAEARFEIVDAQGARAGIDPSLYLMSWQFEEMSTRPDMIVQFAEHVKEEAGDLGLGDVEVRAEVFASLNDREMQRLIDPEVDLAETERQGLLGHADWIVPLRTPLN
jgi:vitamin K-dependent gamma-carboxylase